MRLPCLSAVLPLMMLAVPAQALDCNGDLDQQTMNQCAEADWQAADVELNKAYKAAMAVLTEWDSYLSEDQQGGPKALKEAQIAWITFRDKACEAEGFAMRGGSAEPLLVYGCMARLTEDRTAQLTEFVAMGEGG